MIEPRFRWRRPPIVRLEAEFLAAAIAAGFSDRVAALLHARGVTDVVGLEAFIAPLGEGLHDPALLPDADRLVARIDRARNADEKVLVFGDFDADGLTGLAIMVRALRRIGLDAEPYVPSRLEEGHGLSLRAVDAARGDRADPDRHGGYRLVERGRGRRGGPSRRRCHRHRPPPPAARSAPGRRPRQPTPGGLALPGPAAGRERGRLQGRPAPPSRPARRTGDGPPTGRPGDDRDRRRRRADHRREPGDRPGRPRPDRGERRCPV